MGISSLGYVVLDMQDPEEWATFAEDVLGFGRGADVNGAVRLRMDEQPSRYIVQKAERNHLFAAGLEVPSLDALQAKLDEMGVTYEAGTDTDAALRDVERYVVATDPSGNRVEFYETRRNVGAAFTPGHGITEFNTDPMGLGHMVLPAPAMDETMAFYEALGFGVSDDLTLPAFAEDMPEQRIYFMHADNPRHHTLGLYNFPNPAGVVHVMVEVNTIDEVGMCMDRVKAGGLHIFASLGRHANDEMVSFYFFAPGGIGVEVGYEGKQVKDWSQYTPTKSTSGDLWGHEYDFPVVS